MALQGLKAIDGSCQPKVSTVRVEALTANDQDAANLARLGKIQVLKVGIDERICDDTVISLFVAQFWVSVYTRLCVYHCGYLGRGAVVSLFGLVVPMDDSGNVFQHLRDRPDKVGE